MEQLIKGVILSKRNEARGGLHRDSQRETYEAYQSDIPGSRTKRDDNCNFCGDSNQDRKVGRGRGGEVEKKSVVGEDSGLYPVEHYYVR